MKGKELKLNTNSSRFFRQYLEVIKIFSPYNKLRAKELDVLAEFMMYNNKHSSIEYEDRWKLIMHYGVKVEIRDRLGMSEASFNNILSDLRKKKILVNNKIPEKFLFTIGDHFEFKINFIINEQGKTE